MTGKVGPVTGLILWVRKRSPVGLSDLFCEEGVTIILPLGV